MNKDIAAGKIKQAEGSIQAKWGKISKQDFEKVKGDKDKLVGLIQEKYGEAKDIIEETLNEILGSSAFHETVEAVYQKKDEAVDYAQKMCGDLSEEIKKNPLASVLIGVGIGFLIGKLMK